MSVVSNGIYSATYDYLPNSDLLQTTTFKNNGTTKLATTRSWEYGSRLGAILNQVGSTIVSSHGYQYDSLNRRTRASLEDGSYWQYDYNDRNELIGARHYWPDMYPVSGQHFGYDYDNIGNRESASSGGDINGWNLRTASYEVNNLNQYTTITTPGYKDITGAALATNTVTVNSGTADRKVEYFHREITVANSSGPVWQTVTVSSGGVSSNGGFACPKNSQTLTYDLDGNLTFDGVWTYEWDGENRLKAMTMTNVSGIPNAQRKRLEFAYDYMNRRIQKVVSTWSGSSFTSPVTNQFVYDGWNLLAELDTSHSALRSYMWGQDLSGSMTEAGGIGGLLLVADHVPVTDTCQFVGYDGNGNVTALVSAADQSVSARYEYSAYGELLRSTGPLAMANPFRWSTKFGDEESGLVYYGHRYFSPERGRWFGRDPVEEDGGINLYAMVLNSPANSYDPLGLTSPGNQVPTGWDGKSLEDVQKEVASLEARVAAGEKKLKGHLKAMKRYEKILSRERNPQGRNQNLEGDPFVNTTRRDS
jgi:RHS repeat-associated protein